MSSTCDFSRTVLVLLRFLSGHPIAPVCCYKHVWPYRLRWKLSTALGKLKEEQGRLVDSESQRKNLEERLERRRLMVRDLRKKLVAAEASMDAKVTKQNIHQQQLEYLGPT